MAGALTNRTGHGIVNPFKALFGLDGLFQNDGAAANVTLGDTYPSIWKYDPTGGNRDVTLDPEETSKGLVRLIVNAADAAENLVVKDDSPATIATLNQNEAGLFHCNGTAWSLVCIFTIALS